jgi:transaldolase
MKLFIDSANLADIEDALRTGAVSGVTTNPSILAKEGVTNPLRHYAAIIEVGRRTGTGMFPSLSVELTESELQRMLDEATGIVRGLNYTRLAIKVPIRWSWLPVVRELRDRGVNVNVTACMSYAQAIVAADAGATFVSLFWNRIRDGGGDPNKVVRTVRTTFRENDCKTQIIVGSIRSPSEVTDAIKAGADIVTVPPQFLAPLCEHPKTDEVISQFLRDAKQPIHV